MENVVQKGNKQKDAKIDAATPVLADANGWIPHQDKLTRLQKDMLTSLRSNARLSPYQLARRHHLSMAETESLQQSLKPYIHRYAAMVDFEKIGYPHRLQAIISTADREQLLSYLLSHPAVNNLTQLQAPHDFAIDALFPSLKELYEFQETLAKYAKELQPAYIVEVLKEQGFMSDFSDSRPSGSKTI